MRSLLAILAFAAVLAIAPANPASAAPLNAQVGTLAEQGHGTVQTVHYWRRYRYYPSYSYYYYRPAPVFSFYIGPRYRHRHFYRRFW